MRLLCIFILAFSLGGCAIDLGPDNFRFKVWEQANMELADTPFGSLCFGCYEPSCGCQPEEETPEPDGD